MGIVLAVAGVAGVRWAQRPAEVALYSHAVGIRADGVRVLLPPADGALFLPGSRVLEPGSPGGGPDSPTARAAAQRLATEQRRWIAGGDLPGSGGPYADLARTALLDLDTLLDRDTGAVVAAWSPRWRYVWPRDAAFVVAALTATGHRDDAARILAFLAGVMSEDGTFQARYRPDGAGPPDARGVQLDGTGWFLWATGYLMRAEPDDALACSAVAPLESAVARAGAAAMRLTANPDRLPPASSDYWEVRERELTLGTVAPLQAGLTAAAAIAQRCGGDPATAAAYRDRSAEVANAMRRSFGARGWPRHVTGGPADAAVTFVLPPFRAEADREIVAAARRAAAAMRRPAGGVAPGAGWKRDGISWTPETALFGLASGCSGDRAGARARLDWIAAHRTADGAIPEKVLADGSPAAVAPLAWTAATVLLTLSALQDPAGTCAAP